jgi:ABC-type multidrug transport system, ATPase and permease components
MIIYTLVIKKKIVKYGEKEMRSRVDLMQTITDTFKGYPDIIIGNAFPLMEKRLNKNMDTISTNRIKFSMVTNIPGILMEISMVLCIGFLIIYNGVSNSNTSLTLAVFGVATMRIVPAVRSIISSWTTIKNSSYSIDVIYEGLANYKEKKQELITQTPTFSELIINNLSYSFPDRDVVLNNFSYKIKQGDRIGIKGESGVGKSTLYNIILGLFPNWEKNIKVLDKNNKELTVNQWQKIIGYVPQNVYIFNTSIAENIALNEDFNINREKKIYIKEILKGENPNIHFEIPEHIKKKIDWCIEKAQLKDFINTLPDGIFTTIGDAGSKLSGGQIQRIGIARALYKSPQVLFFDEATSSLDYKTESEITEAIKEIAGENKDLTIIIIAHRESTLEVCDKIINLNEFK